MNLLEGLTHETLAAHGFAWEHLLRWVPLPGGGIRVAVPAGTDYFRDPAGEKTKDNGPYLWRDVAGDFVARLHVRPTFAGRYDAGGSPGPPRRGAVVQAMFREHELRDHSRHQRGDPRPLRRRQRRGPEGT